jgi:hypothetical protein
MRSWCGGRKRRFQSLEFASVFDVIQPSSRLGRKGMTAGRSGLRVPGRAALSASMDRLEAGFPGMRNVNRP